MAKSILFACLFFLISSSLINAQSVYLDSLRNSVSTNFTGVTSPDFHGLGIGQTFTSKSSLDFSLSLSWTQEKKSGHYATGVGVYFGGAVANEKKGAPFGIEIGGIYELSNLDGDDIKSSAFGMGLSLSKRVKMEKTGSTFVPQLSIAALPIVLLSQNNTQVVGDGFTILSISPAFIISSKNRFRLVAEPTFSINLDSGQASGGFGMIFMY